MLFGLTSQTPEQRKKPPKVSAPILVPKKKSVSRQVFLEPELWKELSEAASFHSEVFEEMKAGESVSRNDIIASFLMWALEAYWEDKGGEPRSKDDWNKKVKQHAEKLKEEASRAAASASKK